MKNRLKSSHIRASRYVLLFFALNAGLSWIMKNLLHTNAYINQIFAVILPLIGVTTFFAQRYGGSIRSYFRLFKINTSTIIFMAMLGICTSAAGSYISIPSRQIMEIFGISSEEVFSVPSSIGGLILNSIFAAILPAICEEMFCRGILLREYERYNKVTAVIMSSLYFGLLHSSVFNLPYTMFLGVVLALVCINTGSIFSCIILHFSANMFSLLWSFTVHNVPEFSYDPRFYGALEVIIACLAILFIVLFVMFFINRNKFKSRYYRYSELRRDLLIRPPFGFSLSALVAIVLCIATGIQ